MLRALMCAMYTANGWYSLNEHCCCGPGQSWNGLSCVPCISAGVARGGEPCLEHCTGSHGECSFCGPSGKCCRANVGGPAAVLYQNQRRMTHTMTNDSLLDCQITEGGKTEHICVGSSAAGVRRAGVECFGKCDYRSGACQTGFCGPQGRCCRRGEGLDECGTDEGGFDQHVCIGPQSSPDSCDVATIVPGSRESWSCGGGSQPCSIREGNDGCCCADGFDLSSPGSNELCSPCAGGIDQCRWLIPPFLETTTTDLQCHPSQHTVPCNRPSESGEPIFSLSLVYIVSICSLGFAGMMQMAERSRDYRVRKSLDLLDSKLLQGQEVECTRASTSGRFTIGDRGVIESFDDGAGPLVKFTTGRTENVGEFCLARHDSHGDAVDCEASERHPLRPSVG